MGVLATLLLSGCTHLEQHALFQRDVHSELRPEDDHLIDLPADVQPRLTAESPLPVAAAGPLDLSVEQVTMLVLQNNRELQTQQLNPVIAGTFEQIERGVYDPELFADLEYSEERATETARSTGTQFSVEGSDVAAVAGVRQQLPTGTTVAATIEQDRSISNRAPEQQSARIGVSITQALLRGRRPVANLVRVRQAELETLASRYELRGFTEALLANAEIAYWHYVLAKQAIAIYDSSLAVAQQQRDEIEQRIQVGMLPRTEAAAARAEVARREQALIDARSLLEARRLTLLQLINAGLPDGELERTINATTDPHVETGPITDTADRLQLAQVSRSDLLESRLRLEQRRLETIVTRDGLLPRLDLFFALGRTGYSDTVPKSFRNWNDETDDVTVGLRLSHFLGDRAADARDRAARASRQQGAKAVANLEQLIRRDVSLAINEVERARLQISASAVTRALQEQTLNSEKERFDVGAGTALLVAQAQRDLLASRLSEVESVVNYRIALVKLYLAEGSLLERRGVQLAVGDVP